MNNKMLILTLLVITALFAIWKKQKPSTMLIAQTIEQPNQQLPVGASKTIEQSPTLIVQLEIEVAHMKKELAAIDVTGELNNPATKDERRQWLIEKLNLYSQKMGQLAKLQIAEMEKEVDL